MSRACAPPEPKFTRRPAMPMRPAWLANTTVPGRSIPDATPERAQVDQRPEFRTGTSPKRGQKWRSGALRGPADVPCVARRRRECGRRTTPMTSACPSRTWGGTHSARRDAAVSEGWARDVPSPEGPPASELAGALKHDPGPDSPVTRRGGVREAQAVRRAQVGSTRNARRPTVRRSRPDVLLTFGQSQARANAPATRSPSPFRLAPPARRWRSAS
jgi:hypothetical protein